MESEEFKGASKDPERAGEENPRKDCDSIDERGRRVLCKVCNMPVLGAAPFCKDHEAPVP